MAQIIWGWTAVYVIGVTLYGLFLLKRYLTSSKN